jgi:quercetin dioxygenase-like cupin family protein
MPFDKETRNLLAKTVAACRRRMSAAEHATRSTTMRNDREPVKFTGGKALDLVAYQAGAVVSREIVKKKAGSVTAFAFDKDQGLSEHTAPFDALVHVLDGAAEITIGGESHSVKRGEMILMPANVPHALKAVEQFKMLLVMLREPA